jgi:hypothetical protein
MGVPPTAGHRPFSDLFRPQIGLARRNGQQFAVPFLKFLVGGGEEKKKKGGARAPPRLGSLDYVLMVAFFVRRSELLQLESGIAPRIITFPFFAPISPSD